MRRIAMLTLVLTVSACGHNTWSDPPFTGGADPNRPHGDSVNLMRAMGDAPAVTPLLPEPGDIWPGPLPPMPTLQDIERDSGLSHLTPGATPMPGSSSPPPTSSLPPLPRQLTPVPSSPMPRAAPPQQSGKTVQTPSGPGVTTGGTDKYQTTTTPGGGSAIIVPNGNGTSTVIYPDGRIETIPTPK